MKDRCSFCGTETHCPALVSWLQPELCGSLIMYSCLALHGVVLQGTCLTRRGSAWVGDVSSSANIHWGGFALSSCWFLFPLNVNPQSTHSRDSVRLCCVHVSLLNPHTGPVVLTLVFFTWSPSSVTSTWCGWKLIFLYCYWCSWFLPLVLLLFNGSLVLDVRIHADPFWKGLLWKRLSQTKLHPDNSQFFEKKEAGHWLGVLSCDKRQEVMEFWWAVVAAVLLPSTMLQIIALVKARTSVSHCWESEQCFVQETCYSHVSPGKESLHLVFCCIQTKSYIKKMTQLHKTFGAGLQIQYVHNHRISLLSF